MRKQYDIVKSFASGEKFSTLVKSKSKRVLVRGAVGSSLSVIIAAYADTHTGVHLIVEEDKDSAAYLSNDLTEILGEKEVMFFPSAAKRSILYGGEDLSSIVLRTSALDAIASISKGEKLFVCTYPEAICEKVITTKSIQENSLSLNSGEDIDIKSLVSSLVDYGFVKVDFVYEPGQFSLRGGIVDIFSFGENQPYRLDFFGDTLDSIRIFDVSSQRSQKSVNRVKIVPYIREVTEAHLRESIFEFINKIKGVKSTIWFDGAPLIENKIGEIYSKLSAKNEEADNLVINLAHYAESLSENKLIFCRADTALLPADKIIDFNISGQPTFHKNFDLLANEIDENTLKGYQTYILTRNKVQVERLENIFNSIGRKNIHFENIDITLHVGFVDNDQRCCYYTDHQLFDRYHKYKINREIVKSKGMAISELNSLSLGDYIVHIDHGVGKFGGLVRSIENGKSIESIKLTYKDNDILLVNVHSLHKISKYKDKDSEPPKLHKLGTSTWQKFKTVAKNKVKDIARDLIALYAKRRVERGHAFAPNTYMQEELEASFLYEDTPDQQTTTEAVYKDMESPIPMDRLVCGDVGYGKTEIAIRAAFKAVCDNKQVAVLVPTTVLSLQHYRTFSRRLKEFPVTVENLSRAKSAKQTREITADIESGKIDIIVGTHKLLSKSLKFKDLGLLIIDEEQKFGVSAKEKLKSIKANVDTVTLTATPIPRTLQFSLMGARDLSIINTPPPNRQPVTTEVHSFSEEIIREAIDTEIKRGGQVFLLHNRVKSIEHMAAIVNKIVPEARTVVAHGQMSPADMEKRMMDFIYGEYDVLIATTIIESGIDIPNANTIIINDAQNFGLSDLHQLRGRVGRTNTKAYCYLLLPDYGSISENAHRRIKAIEDFSDLGSGFNIAMQDLDIRGAGNILGSEQSGFISDIGYETYQKIMAEAIAELKNEENIEIGVVETEDKRIDNWSVEAGAYVSDCQIDIDSEAIIPDSYIGSVNEKINLYKQIDRLTNSTDALMMKESLIDRFGKLPKATLTLFDVVAIRKVAIELGFEKAIIKNGYFIIHFVSNKESAYYKSEIFSHLMSFIGDQPANFKLKPKENRLLLSIAEVKSSAAALEIIEKMREFVKNQIEKK